MRTIDLFSGCGGMSLGFQDAGYEIVAAFDHWKPAIQTYRRNFSHPIYEADLGNLKSYEMFSDLTPDLIIGGPPCQDFSSAGKRNEKLGRADLTLSFAEIVTNVRPQWFVMENVERVTKSHILQEAKALLKASGYGLSETVLKASLCGVPQDRKRYFLIGELNGPDHAILPYFQKNVALTPMTIYDYLGDRLGVEYYYRHPRNYSRRGVYSIHEPSPTVRGVNRPVPNGYKGHPADPPHDRSLLRPLTTKERSYLQTFPESFIFNGSKSDLEQMIGNAVPVKLAFFVAKSLLEYRQNRATRSELKLNRAAQLSLFE